MRRILSAILVALLLVGGSSPAFAQEGNSGNRLIVVFKAGVGLGEQTRIARAHGAAPIKPLRLIDALVVTVPNQAAKVRLASDRSVVRVDDDVIVKALGKPSTGGKTPPPQPAQTLPWGIDRIDAELARNFYTGAGVKVGVIDTGIDIDHADLVANIKGGVNTINPRKSFNDDDGHGTHVAGTIAAANNSIGVIGGAPAVNLYGIKVLNSRGTGYLSDVIEGLDWARLNGMQVVNMSLGSPYNIQSMYDAVFKVYQAGITIVAAAGNESGPVSYPAAYEEVIAVSAINSSDQFAGFSNSGPQVDLAAPGVGIYSTYNNGLYGTADGTSMASPHVAAVAALVLSKTPTLTPDQVSAQLKATASPLAGLSEYQQGAGLVNALAAVQ